MLHTRAEKQVSLIAQHAHSVYIVSQLTKVKPLENLFRA